METIVKFSKVKENAIIPSKRNEDMGFDIYACFNEDNFIIQPHETRMIPTGLASAFMKDFGCILKERGSTGTRGIGLRAGVIDSGFRNEWAVVLTNHNDKPIVITKETDIINLLEDYIVYPYTKAIAQAIFISLPKITIEEVPYAELLKIESERGLGMLGSSNK